MKFAKNISALCYCCIIFKVEEIILTFLLQFLNKMVIMTTLPSECKTCKKNKERLLIKQIHYKVMIGRRAFKHAHIGMPSRDRMKNLNDGCMMLVLMTYNLIP